MATTSPYHSPTPFPWHPHLPCPPTHKSPRIGGFRGPSLPQSPVLRQEARRVATDDGGADVLRQKITVDAHEVQPLRICRDGEQWRVVGAPDDPVWPELL